MLSVTVPVADQDAALAFYTGVLGCELRYDVEVEPGARMIEVVPPGSPVGLVLLPPDSPLPVAVRLGTTDVDAAHAALAEVEGVVLHNAEVLRWDGVPPMFHFSDPQGNDLVYLEDERLDPLSSAAATLAVLRHVLRGVDEEALDAPTPCTEFTVAQLEAHLLGSISSLTHLAGGEVVPATTGDLEHRVARSAQQALEAWALRGLDGEVGAGAQRLPASTAASILSLELLVHAWDFAAATGRRVVVSEEVAGYVLGLAEHVIVPSLRASAGFGPAVPVSAEAAALDRLVAFTGRAATWSSGR